MCWSARQTARARAQARADAGPGAGDVPELQRRAWGEREHGGICIRINSLMSNRDDLVYYIIASLIVKCQFALPFGVPNFLPYCYTIPNNFNIIYEKEKMA